MPGQPNGRPRASQRTCAGVVDALRQRRIHLGLSAVDVARAMGVSPRSVYAWEDGARSPDAHALERYAEAVSTTLLIGPVIDVDHVAVERVAAGTAPWRSLNHDERHAAFALLRDRGLTRTAIARQYGLSWTAATDLESAYQRAAGHAEDAPNVRPSVVPQSEGDAGREAA